MQQQKCIFVDKIEKSKDIPFPAGGKQRNDCGISTKKSGNNCAMLTKLKKFSNSSSEYVADLTPELFYLLEGKEELEGW